MDQEKRQLKLGVGMKIGGFGMKIGGLERKLGGLDHPPPLGG